MHGVFTGRLARSRRCVEGPQPGWLGGWLARVDHVSLCASCVSSGAGHQVYNLLVLSFHRLRDDVLRGWLSFARLVTFLMRNIGRVAHYLVQVFLGNADLKQL